MRGFLILLTSLYLFAGCERKTGTISTPATDEGIYNVEIIQKNYEKKSYELWALELMSKKDTIWGRKIKVIFFDTAGDTTSVLYADRGWYVEKTGNVGALGHVRIYATRGDSLFTDRLFYIDTKREIRSPSRVIIYRNGEKIVGNGLRTDVGFKKVEIGGKVIGEKSD